MGIFESCSFNSQYYAAERRALARLASIRENVIVDWCLFASPVVIESFDCFLHVVFLSYILNYCKGVLRRLISVFPTKNTSTH